MKRRFFCPILALVLSFSVILGLFSTETVKPVIAESSLPEKHLILNADGSYGGSANVELYGEGAPKNGEYDLESSPYYTVNDFYNMKCTNEERGLTLLPNFKPYQQTMSNSSAFACLVMALNYMGKNVSSEYSELSLVQKYEQANSETVKQNGVSEIKLKNFIQSLNLGVTIEQNFDTGLDTSLQTFLSDKLAENLSKGYIMLVRFQSATGYNWKVVIGVDKMGTEITHDDVIIFADPFDSFDHYQDGYSTIRLGQFLVWRRFVDVNGATNPLFLDETVVINAGLTPNFQKEDRDKTQKITEYELHHILNADGSYGGTRDAEKYGSIGAKDGNWNVLYSNYYKTNDFYNMGDEGTRVLLEEYAMFQQTMSSSCGPSSIMSILRHYGHDVDESMEVTLVERYEEISGEIVKGRGTTYLYNTELLKEYGLKANYIFSEGLSEPAFPTYESYRDFMKENLEKDRPVMTSIRNRGGHWVVVIGFDDMGTDYIYDDVFIISDSNDYWDHYHDGYNTYPATQFYRLHFNKSLSTCYGLVHLEESPSNALLLIGIIAGAVVVLGGGAFATYFFLKKKKSKN